MVTLRVTASGTLASVGRKADADVPEHISQVSFDDDSVKDVDMGEVRKVVEKVRRRGLRVVRGRLCSVFNLVSA